MSAITLRQRRVACGLVSIAALAAGACSSLDSPPAASGSETSAASLRRPRLAEDLLGRYGLEELWYFGDIPTDSGRAEIERADLLPEGLFVVANPASSRGERHLIRLDRESGQALWYESLDVRLLYPPTSYTYPATIDKDPELYYLQGDRVVCVDLESGLALWQKEMPFPSISTPVVADSERIFMGDAIGRCYAVIKQHSVDSWSYITRGRVQARPLVTSERVIFASHDGSIVSLLPATGGDPLESWRFQTGGSVQGDVVLYDRWLFFGSSDYKLYCLRRDGSVRWSFVAEAPIREAPVVYQYRPNREFVFSIVEPDALRGTPRRLFAIPLPKGDDVVSVHAAWRLDNVRKVVSIGRDHLYVLLEPGAGGERPLAALDFETGKEAFRIDVEGFHFVPANLANNGRNPVERGRIYLVSTTGAVQAIGEKLR